MQPPTQLTRTKACFRLHITSGTLELVRKAVEKGFNINKDSFRATYRRGLARLKHVRKFAMNAMHTAGLTLDDGEVTLGSAEAQTAGAYKGACEVGVKGHSTKRWTSCRAEFSTLYFL